MITLPDQVHRLRHKLLSHPLYASIQSLDALHVYMQHHVFAVWDFMSLLKRLQQDLTGVRVPWVPGPDPRFARFLNEIVLAEESDEDGQGSYDSHFGLYLSAMRESGANTRPIMAFITGVRAGQAPMRLLEQIAVPPSVSQFVQTSLDLALRGATHEVAAAFFYGREDIIPDMFRNMVQTLSATARLERFLYYLNRHIEVDSDHHGPMARQLLADLIGSDTKREAEAKEAASRSLKSRIQLWDGVLQEIRGLTTS